MLLVPTITIDTTIITSSNGDDDDPTRIKQLHVRYQVSHQGLPPKVAIYLSL